MEILKYNNQSIDVILLPQDVESAVRQFICDWHPEYKINWALNAKYNLGAAIFVGTKGDLTPKEDFK